MADGKLLGPVGRGSGRNVLEGAGNGKLLDPALLRGCAGELVGIVEVLSEVGRDKAPMGATHDEGLANLDGAAWHGARVEGGGSARAWHGLTAQVLADEEPKGRRRALLGGAKGFGDGGDKDARSLGRDGETPDLGTEPRGDSEPMTPAHDACAARDRGAAQDGAAVGGAETCGDDEVWESGHGRDGRVWEKWGWLEGAVVWIGLGGANAAGCGSGSVGSGRDGLGTQLLVLGSVTVEARPALDGKGKGLVNEAPMIGAHEHPLLDEPRAALDWAGVDIDLTQG